MRPITNFDKVKPESGDFDRIKAGGYVCKIKDVEDIPYDPQTGKGDYLRIEFDIATGDYKDYYSKRYARFGGYWGGNLYRSYKETAIGMFKYFIQCVENSNLGFVYNFDEKQLIGKVLGLVLAEEEYIKRDGTIGTRIVPSKVKTVQEINAGEFFVPTKKTVEAPQYSGGTSDSHFTELSSDDKLPF